MQNTFCQIYSYSLERVPIARGHIKKKKTKLDKPKNCDCCQKTIYEIHHRAILMFLLFFSFQFYECLIFFFISFYFHFFGWLTHVRVLMRSHISMRICCECAYFFFLLLSISPKVPNIFFIFCRFYCMLFLSVCLSFLFFVNLCVLFPG